MEKGKEIPQGTVNTAETSMNIYQAMAKIMRSVEAIKKEKTNTQGSGFKYRGIDDVMNSLHDSFAEASVFITIEVMERLERDRPSKSGGVNIYVTQKIKFTFHAPDGSSVYSVINGTAMDSGDKADNKSLSIGLKYALLQSFLIPTEDMAEADAHTYEVMPQKQASATKEATPAKDGVPQPMTNQMWVKFVARLGAGETTELPDKIRKAFILNAEQDRTLSMYEKENHQPVTA